MRFLPAIDPMLITNKKKQASILEITIKREKNLLPKSKLFFTRERAEKCSLYSTTKNIIKIKRRKKNENDRLVYTKKKKN